jgi:hypothetical protein
MENFLRANLTPEQRALPLEHTIDPGFVHRRAIETVIGPTGMKAIDDAIKSLPPMPEWSLEARIDRIYTDVLLMFCEVVGVKTLSEVLAVERGQMFCSTEVFAPCEDVYEAKRTSSVIIPSGEASFGVRLEYSTSHISGDTLRMELNQGGTLSVVAMMNRREGNMLIFRPLVIGSPWLRSEDPKWEEEIMWWGRDFYEHYIEDFDEFARVRDIPEPESVEPMREVSEKAFKRCLGKLLHDPTVKDWGGETSDHFTAHLHLQGKRVTGAFLLKGPAKFAPMTLNYLGKNNDQIYRLSQEPAEVLIVQHAHEITSPVRATLRAFAVQPSRPRRYALFDGRDSLRLLLAYELYDEAVRLTRENAG